MKVAIDVLIEPGVAGGIAQAVHSLIGALGSLDDGPEEYSIIVRSDRQIDWLHPLAANQKFIVRPNMRHTNPLHRALSPIVGRLRTVLTAPRAWPEVPVSDGFYESLGCDVVHFPTQEFTLCAVPSVYNPHDLQHLHHPQFFVPSEIAWREVIYPAGCHFANSIIVNSQWIKDDVIQQYGANPNKLQIIPEAPPTQFSRQPSTDDTKLVQGRYGLPKDYALYPSVTWPHKNHLRLLDALAYLRDRRGVVLPLVCTGSRHEASWPQIEARITQLGLSEQLHFLGFVPHEDLRSIYQLARCLVLPTLYEANSLPIFEAWLEGVPVACSNVTALPEQVLDAGLLFDPLDCTAIGDTLHRLASDARLREELRTNGRRRLADFDWKRTAKAYRAVYRRTAGQRLSEEDRTLLQWDWMRNPRRMTEVQA